MIRFFQKVTQSSHRKPKSESLENPDIMSVHVCMSVYIQMPTLPIYGCTFFTWGQMFACCFKSTSSMRHWPGADV